MDPVWQVVRQSSVSGADCGGRLIIGVADAKSAGRKQEELVSDVSRAQEAAGKVGRCVEGFRVLGFRV